MQMRQPSAIVGPCSRRRRYETIRLVSQIKTQASMRSAAALVCETYSLRVRRSNKYSSHETEHVAKSIRDKWMQEEEEGEHRPRALSSLTAMSWVWGRREAHHCQSQEEDTIWQRLETENNKGGNPQFKTYTLGGWLAGWASLGLSTHWSWTVWNAAIATQWRQQQRLCLTARSILFCWCRSFSAAQPAATRVVICDGWVFAAANDDVRGIISRVANWVGYIIVEKRV